MSATLDHALAVASPRRAPPPTPWPSLLIHGAVIAVWSALILRAVLPGEDFGWWVGVGYVLYDTFLLAFVAWNTRDLIGKPASKPLARGSARPTLAVVIAAYNEADALPATLAALRAQSDPADLVVVADDGSNDDTQGVLAGHEGLSVLRLPHGGKARALNAAITDLSADIVVTVDADTHLHPSALAAMRAAFAAEPALVAATGVLVPVCGPSPEGRLFEWFQTYEYVRNFLSRYAWMRADGLLLISGAFAGFRRGAVIAVGGFETECLVEDYELIHRLRRYGAERGLPWTTRVLGGAVGRTGAPQTLRAFLRQRRRWFGGFLQTQYWYRDMVGSARFGRVGTWMLPVKAADTLQPIGGLVALAVALTYAATGRVAMLLPIGGVVAGKLALDLCFHLWSVRLFRSWLGATRPGYGAAILAALAEPFSFQILRHVGAAWGWVAFLTGDRRWGAVRSGRTGG